MAGEDRIMLLGLVFALTGFACFFIAMALVVNGVWNLISGKIQLFTNYLIFWFLINALLMGSIVIFLAATSATSGKSDDFYEHLTGPEAWKPWLFLLSVLMPHLLWFSVFRSPRSAAFISVASVLCGAPEFWSALAGA